MNEAIEHVDSEATPEADEALQGRTRTCVGCGERVAVLGPGGADFVRLILGPGGEIAVDPKGGGFGRGAHVHARRACLERAARGGLLRATKGKAHLVLEGGIVPVENQAVESDKGAPLSAESLARAIQRSMDRRIEGLLRAAGRSRQVARGTEAVTAACQRSEATLVVVACDAPAAADLSEVRLAVADGRAVAWGTKERLGAIVAPSAVRSRLGSPFAKTPSLGAGAPGPEGVGVVAITSRKIADALRQAVQAANAVTLVEPAPKRGSITLGGTPRPPVTGASRSGGRGSRWGVTPDPRPAGPRGAMRAGDRRNDG